MEIDISYDYINLLAFANLLKYENKREITLRRLEKFHDVMASEILEIANEREDTTIDNFGSLEEFLVEYNDYFYKKGNTLYLKDDITYEDINNLLQNFDFSFVSLSLMQRASEHPYPLGALGIHTIHDVLLHYLTIEREIYCEYQKEDYTNKKYLLMRALFCHNLSNYPFYALEALRNISWYIAEDDLSYDYPQLPFNEEIWNQYLISQYGTDEVNYEEQNIENNLYEGYQYAIFGSSSLIYTKLEYMLDEIDSEKSGEKDNTELIFYLKYLALLIKYINKYGDNNILNKTKNRLLYLLDNPDRCLYQKTNLDKVLDDTLNYELKLEDLALLKVEIYFFANEIFIEKENNYTVRKMLLVATFYALTYDLEIKNIIEKYNDHPLYDYYAKIILGENYQYRRIK